MTLRNAAALITGGSSAVGRAIARALLIKADVSDEDDVKRTELTVFATNPKD